MVKWGASPSDHEQHAHMAMRQKQNIEQSKRSRAEDWMMEKLKTTGLKWTRQARWGWRIFDFWNHQLGIAIEVDGPEHSKERDERRDARNWHRSRIIVLRVPNFDEATANAALSEIANAQTWNERREEAQLSLIKT